MKNYYKINGATCYLSEETYTKDLSILEAIKTKIENALNGSNLAYVDFTDVSAGGIQVRGFHKEIAGYSYMSETLLYDYSNKDSIVDKFVDAWRSLDNKEHLSGYKSFLADGEKYGWD